MVARFAAATCTGAAAAASSPALSPASFFEQPVRVKRIIRAKYAYLLMAGFLSIFARSQEPPDIAQARHCRRCGLHLPWFAHLPLPMLSLRQPDSAGLSSANSRRKDRKKTGAIRLAPMPSA